MLQEISDPGFVSFCHVLVFWGSVRDFNPRSVFPVLGFGIEDFVIPLLWDLA